MGVRSAASRAGRTGSGSPGSARLNCWIRSCDTLRSSSERSMRRIAAGESSNRSNSTRRIPTPPSSSRTPAVSGARVVYTTSGSEGKCWCSRAISTERGAAPSTGSTTARSTARVRISLTASGQVRAGSHSYRSGSTEQRRNSRPSVTAARIGTCRICAPRCRKIALTPGSGRP